RLIEVAMRDAARHAYQIAGPGLRPFAVELEVEFTFLDEDEFVLGRMNMDRHELAGLTVGLEGEARCAHGFRKITLTQNVPALPAKPCTIGGDTLLQIVGHSLSFLVCYFPGPNSASRRFRLSAGHSVFMS